MSAPHGRPGDHREGPSGPGAWSASTTARPAWTIRARPGAPRGIPYFEKYAWLFMRFSGIVLVVLVSATCSSC